MYLAKLAGLPFRYRPWRPRHVRLIAADMFRPSNGEQLAHELHLGNLDSRRDWGYAGDYVRAMWLMLQQDHPDDYVVGTGTTHSVRELCQAAFGCLDLDWEQYVVVDPRFYRPAEVDLLVSDPSKARETLGWEPKVGFEELIEVMVRADLDLLRAENEL